MGKDTSIQWADSSLNLQMGCDGCELWTGSVRKCYAGRQTRGRQGFPGWPARFEEPKLFLDRLPNALKWKDLTGTDRAEKPWLNGFPRIVFLNDMGDTFSNKLPLDWMAPLLPAMDKSPHQFLILTKRPSRFAEFTAKHPLPLNVWPGTSVTTQKTTNRVAQLARVRGGGPRFVSFEPMFEEPLPEAFDGIQWAIFGGESGDADDNVSAFDCGALENAIAYATQAGVRVFVKQLGRLPFYFTHDGEPEPLPIDPDPHHGDWQHWPDNLRVRQMPKLLIPQSLL